MFTLPDDKKRQIWQYKYINERETKKNSIQFYQLQLMVKQQCLFGTLLIIKVPGRHFLFTRATSQSPCLHETLATAAITRETCGACFSQLPESWRKGVKMTEPNRQSGESEERIIEIEIERLRPFKEHPFQVKDS